MGCSQIFPIPEEDDTIIVLRGDLTIVRNFALSAVLHCVNLERFCYYIGNSTGSFEKLTAFDGCKFRVDTNDFLIPKDAASPESVVKRIQEIGKKANPALVILECPESCSPYGIVNILGYLQDLQLRCKSNCLILVNDSEMDRLIPEKLSDFYKLKVYLAFRWGLKTKRGVTAVSFVEHEGRLNEVLQTKTCLKESRF